MNYWLVQALVGCNKALLRGDFTNLSERKLMDCLNRLGYDIEIKIKPASEPLRHLVLAVA